MEVEMGTDNLRTYLSLSHSKKGKGSEERTSQTSLALLAQPQSWLLATLCCMNPFFELTRPYTRLLLSRAVRQGQ